MAQLFAGTSGFAYPAWKPGFYPAKLPSAKFLEHYATRLNAVEINYTFRRMPPATTLQNWHRQTAAPFLFALKAHQRITHIFRLKNAGEATEAFFRSIDPLRSARRLGPVLFQLPPNLKCDAGLLGEFLALLPGDVRCAIEFRHASWFNDEIYALLEGRGVALCLAESERIEAPKVFTAGFVYSRLRKPDYTVEDRAAIKAQARDLLAIGKDVYVFFKHEETPDGALYAEELLR
ncbi:MAG: DUF72 domain-containing protein [Bryobacteraceae bacterium]